MDVLATATIEEAAERSALDKNFRDYLDDFSESNKVVFAESLALAMIQVAAYPNGYITIEDCPTLAGATKVEILTITPLLIDGRSIGETPFTYRVNGGEPLKGNLTDIYGCYFAV